MLYRAKYFNFFVNIFAANCKELYVKLFKGTPLEVTERVIANCIDRGKLFKVTEVKRTESVIVNYTNSW